MQCWIWNLMLNSLVIFLVFYFHTISIPQRRHRLAKINTNATGHHQRSPVVIYFAIYLTRVLVNQGSSPMEGTAVSMRGWDLMNCRVSSGNSTELLKDAAGPWPAQHPGLQGKRSKINLCDHTPGRNNNVYCNGWKVQWEALGRGAGAD